MGSSSFPKRRVFVLGAQSPNRVAALSLVLTDAISRHGWSERIETLCGGFGAGIGVVDDAALKTAGVAECGPPPARCPDFETETERIDASDILVAITAEELDELLGWPEADGKQLFALSDFLGDDGWAVRDRGASLVDYVEQVREGVPLLLRAILARTA